MHLLGHTFSLYPSIVRFPWFPCIFLRYMYPRWRDERKPENDDIYSLEAVFVDGGTDLSIRHSRARCSDVPSGPYA